MTFIEEYKNRFPAQGPNVPIEIAQNQSYTYELNDGRVIQGKVDIQLRLLPRVKIQFTDRHTNLRWIDILANDKFKLHVDDLGSDIEVIVSSLTDGQNCVFQLNDDNYLIHKEEPVVEVCCSLINFRPMNFPINLAWGKWRVKVMPVAGLKQIQKELHTNGGYAVTHLVTITNDGSATFVLSEFKSMWDGLYHLFSFANGGWSTPVLPIGYNSTGEIVFQQLQPRITSLWCDSTRNWFDEMKPEILDNLFPGFMSVFTDSIWENVLRTSIYWYVNSERSLPSLDTTIILAQSALELLAWQYLVIDKKIFSEKEFKKNWTSENIRRILLEEKIDATFPPQCHALLSRFAIYDGPFAITELRNDIVHPVPKNPLNLVEMNQVWDLGMFYIERIILNLCLYLEPVPNRCRYG